MVAGLIAASSALADARLDAELGRRQDASVIASGGTRAHALARCVVDRSRRGEPG